MFEYETSHEDRIIFLRMSGVMSLDEAHACAAAKEAEVARLGPPYDDHSSLVDIRDLRIQSQEVLGVFTTFVANTKHKSRRIAIVGGEGTARMQFRRLAEIAPLRDDMRFFTDAKEARDWLGENKRAAASAVPSRASGHAAAEA